MKLMTIVLTTLLLLGLTIAADCSANAYRNACASCSFDANGKIDSQCMGGQKAAGIACTSTSYPIASAKYAKGECSEIDTCASELSSCTAQYSSGNDKADCAEGSVAICYAAADQCVKQAAIKCGEIQSPCSAPTGMILLVAGLVGFAKLKN